MQPPPRRVVRQHSEPDGNGGGEACQGRGRLAEPAGEQQVRHEDQRHQLDPGGDAGRGALPPAAPAARGDVRLQEVPQDEGRQDEVDLAEVDGAHHGLQPEGGRRGEQGRAEPDPAVSVAEAAEGEPERRHQGDNVADDGHDRQRRPVQDGGDGERDRGERRIGELEREVAVAAPVVKRRVGVRVVVRRDVPDDQAAVLVYGEVHLVERAERTAERGIDQPAHDHGGEGDGAGPQEPGSRGATRPRGFAGAPPGSRL